MLHAAEAGNEPGDEATTLSFTYIVHHVEFKKLIFYKALSFYMYMCMHNMYMYMYLRCFTVDREIFIVEKSFLSLTYMYTNYGR